MTGFRIKHVHLRNWTTIASADLDMPDCGLVLVLGNNLASDGHLDSLGSGKTNFGMALARLIVGVPDRPIGKFSPRNTKRDTYARIDGLLNDEKITIEAGFKCNELSRTSEGLRFSLGDQKPISLGHVNNTKNELSTVIGIPPQLARWVTWIDGEHLHFNDLSQREAVDLLMTAMRQPNWADVQRQTVGITAQFERDLTTATTHHRRSTESIVSLTQRLASEEQSFIAEQQRVTEAQRIASGNVAEEELALDELKRQLNRVAKLQSKLASRLKVVEEQHAVEYAKLERTSLAANSALQIARDALATVKSNVTIATAEWQREAKLLNVPTDCPTCGQKWPIDVDRMARIRSKVAELKAEVAQAESKVSPATEVVKTKQDELNIIYERLRKERTTAKMTAIRQRSQRLTRIGDALRSKAVLSEVKLAKLKAPIDVSRVKAAEAKINVTREFIAEATADVNKQAKEIAELTSAIAVTKYWHTAFGPTGIANMVLRDMITPLNQAAQRISQVLCGGKLCVKFSTDKTLASGDGRDQLVVSVENATGSDDLALSSKGERGLVNLVIAELIAEVCQAHRFVKFAWYDEVANNLPSQVRLVVLRYLREKAKRNGQLIFIVDHYPESSSCADAVLMAEKTTAGTTLKWY